MATVFLAKDTRHDREVAIKVLHPDLAATIGSERFEREIKLAARLQHPHILGLHDSGAANGLLYYVMPFVRGESLRDRLNREGQLSVDDAVQIILECADALGFAHGQGIVHRDIKPENILLSNGHALVADFGIARAVQDVGSAQKLTQTGMTLGTPVYMSPEQAAGEGVGPTADLYSLGCVLYEMLAGEPPFTGKNSMAIMSRHAMDTVPSIRIVRPAVPEEVEEAIYAAMEKLPVDRPKSAADFAAILGMPLGATATRRVTSRHTATRRIPTPPQLPKLPWWRTRRAMIGAAIAIPVLVASGLAVRQLLGNGRSAAGAVEGEKNVKRVAVLYFEDLTKGKLAYLADGLTETLIDHLQAVQTIDIVAKEGVSRLRGQNPSDDSVAKVLQAGTLVRGSVAENGNRIGVDIRIVDGNGGGVMERASLDLSPGDELALSNTVVDSVRSRLGHYLGAEIARRTLRGGTNNAAAWTLVQRAEKLRKDALTAAASNDTTATAKNFAEADALLVRAEGLDRRWSAPVALRATLAFNRAQSTRSVVALPVFVDSGLAHVERAIQLDASNADAWEIRGRLHYLRWQRELVTGADDARMALERADSSLSKATALDRTRAGTWNILSNVRSDKDDFTGAKLAAQRAYDEDPLQTSITQVVYNLYRTSYNLDQAADASKWCREGVGRFQRNRLFVRCRLWLRTMRDIPVNAASVDSAWIEAKEFEELSPASGREFARREAQLLVGATLARAGMADSGRKVLLRNREGVTPQIDPENSLLYFEAVVRIMFKDPRDTDEAFALMRRYVSGNPAHREGLGKTQMWWWNPLRADSRWESLVTGR
jgi:serine/threonine-protein kinase